MSPPARRPRWPRLVADGAVHLPAPGEGEPPPATPPPPVDGPPPPAPPEVELAGLDDPPVPEPAPPPRPWRTRSGRLALAALAAQAAVAAALAVRGAGVALALLSLALPALALWWLAVRPAGRVARVAEACRRAVVAPPLAPLPASEGEDGQLGRAVRALWDAAEEQVRTHALAREAAELAERERAAGEERLALVLDGSQDGFWDWDLASGAVSFSRRWAEMLGYKQEELRGHVSTWRALLHPGDAPEVMRALEEHLAGHSTSYQTEHRLRARNGEWRWVLDRGAVVQRGEDGAPLRMTGTHSDVTARKRAEEDLRRLNEDMARNLASLTARNREFALLGELTAMLQACRRFEEAHEVLARVLPGFFPGTAGSLHLGSAKAGQADAVVTWGGEPEDARPFGFDDCWALRMRRPHVVGAGEVAVACSHLPGQPGWSSACIPLSTQRDVAGVLSLRTEGALPPSRMQLARTVTDAVVLSLDNLQLRESLQQQSHSDPLTGLSNRRSMQEMLDRELTRARRTGRPLGLCMVDVDHFKRFNDTWGHEAGDAVLVEVGKALKAAVRSTDLVARFGGEEFTVILPESPLPATIRRAEALRLACQALRLRHLGHDLPQITISVGVAELPDHASVGEDLLRQADAALYQAKQGGRNRVAVAEDTVLPGPGPEAGGAAAPATGAEAGGGPPGRDGA